MKAMISADMKQANRKVVFDLVRKRRTCTRVELAELTGMSGPSIMAIVNEFLDKGILTATGKQTGAAGRRPTTMSFNPQVITALGVEYEGRWLSVGLVDLDGEILASTRQEVAAGFDENFYHALCDCLDDVIAQGKAQGLSYHAIGFGIPGAIDSISQIVHFAPYIGIHQPRDISTMVDNLARRYLCPVCVENDVNARAVGEYYRRRLHEELSDMLYVSLGAGVGAALMFDGKLRHGRHGLCGEFGYSLANATDTVSRQSVGWLENQLSWEALCHRFPSFADSGHMTADMITYVADTLTPFIANLVNTLDVAPVVLGGELMRAEKALLFAVQERLQRLTLCGNGVLGSCSSHAGVVGSALLATDQLWQSIL